MAHLWSICKPGPREGHGLRMDHKCAMAGFQKRTISGLLLEQPGASFKCWPMQSDCSSLLNFHM